MIEAGADGRGVMRGDVGELPRDVASQVAANDRGPSRVLFHEGSHVENEPSDDDPTIRLLVVTRNLFGPKYRESPRSIERRRPGIAQRRAPNKSILSDMETFSSAATLFQVSSRTCRSWPLVDWFLPNHGCNPEIVEHLGEVFIEEATIPGVGMDDTIIGLGQPFKPHRRAGPFCPGYSP